MQTGTSSPVHLSDYKTTFRVTVKCGATDKMRVVKVEILVEVATNKVLGCFTGIHVQPHVIHLHFIIGDQLHSVTSSSSLYHQSPATQRHHVIVTLSSVTSYAASHRHHDISYTASSSLYHQ